MTSFDGIRIIESALLVKDGEPCEAWLSCGGGWKAKRIVVPKVPYAVRVDDSTMVMHPALLRQLRAVTR